MAENSKAAESKDEKPTETTKLDTQAVDTPSTAVVTEVTPVAVESRLGKLKQAFLYVLILGLVAAALTSVIALLIGNFFSEAIGKSLLTIFIFFSHSLLILGVLWADRYNEVGRKILPTSIVVLVFASMISTTLGTWEIIDAELAWRIQGLYFLILGAIFVILGTLRLRVQQTATQISAYIAVGLVSAMVLAVAPWILQVVEKFDPLYFRIVAALAILAATSFLITLVLRGIAVGHNAELAKQMAPKKQIPGGLLAIYITVGVIASMVWFSGFIGFIVSAADASKPPRTERLYDRSYDNDYDSSNRYR